MGIRVQWDNDAHTVVRYDFERQWTWEDFYTAKNAATALIDSVENPVAVMFDIPADVIVPSNFVSRMTGMLRQKHKRSYALVIVGGNSYTRALLGVLSSLADRMGSLLKVFNTLDEARAWIQEQETQRFARS